MRFDEVMAIIDEKIEKAQRRAELSDRAYERWPNAESETQQRVQHGILVALVMLKDDIERKQIGE